MTFYTWSYCNRDVSIAVVLIGIVTIEVVVTGVFKIEHVGPFLYKRN
jgi:hypothetical protein